MRAATKLARDLRNEGVNTELDITDRKLDKQIKTAIKKNIPYILFVGQDEVKSELYTLKDTTSTDEQKLSFARIVGFIKDKRRTDIDDDLA